jgi:hypothetical protein
MQAKERMCTNGNYSAYRMAVMDEEPRDNPGGEAGKRLGQAGVPLYSSAQTQNKPSQGIKP